MTSSYANLTEIDLLSFTQMLRAIKKTADIYLDIFFSERRSDFNVVLYSKDMLSFHPTDTILGWFLVETSAASFSFSDKTEGLSSKNAKQ